MRIQTSNPKFCTFDFFDRAIQAGVITALLSAGVFHASADQLPNPVVTASARPYSPAYAATNLFDAANGEYASLTQGAVTVPFTREATNGTWVELDFGSTVEFDRFVFRSRANAADIVGQSRLIVSSDETFDESDQIFTFDPTGFNGAAMIQNLYRMVSGRYARWEATSRAGGGLNLGGNQMWFLKTPPGQTLLPAPAVIYAYEPYSEAYSAARAVDGDYGSEYASLGGMDLTGIDFDFGSPRAITGFEFLNRYADRVSTFDLVFANSADFLEPVSTLNFTSDTNGNWVNSATFPAVTAQYVRLQATGFEGAVNTGVREIQFFTTVVAAPTLTKSPAGGTRYTGDRFVLQAAAQGSNPITFQWTRDGSEIAGATNATLVLPSLATNDAGTYRVAVTTPGGTITSDPAVLTVLDPALDIESDLLLHLKLDETTGDIASDSSGDSRDGTIYGVPGDDSQWVEGRIDGGLRFNVEGAAGDDFLLIPANESLDFSATREFTIAAWINGAIAQENGAGIVANGTGQGGEQFSFDVDAGVYRFYVRNDAGVASVYPTTARPSATWQHVAIVYSAALERVKFYVNGAEILSGTPPATLLQNFADTSIGSRQAGTGDFDLNFDGTLDDVRIYGRALTARDVNQLYSLPSLVGPTIVIQPVGGDFFALDNVTLSVLADGSAPLSYQWSKGSELIAGATNATLSLPNVSTADAASYTVTVVNSVGQVTSSPTVVAVSDPAPNPENGLALHYKLDETSGIEVADASGNNRAGYLQGFVEQPWTTGLSGGALAFNPDGAAGDDTLLVNEDGGLDFETTREFSLAAWVKGSALQEAGAAFIARGTGAGGEQYAFDIYNGIRFYVRNQDGAASVYGTSVLLNDTWQHVAAVYSQPLNRVRVYLNGTEIARGVPPETLLATGSPVTIGSRQSGFDLYDLNFQGLMDDVRIYNRAISPREVQSLSASGAPPALEINRTGDSITISWPAGTTHALYSSDSLAPGNWAPVAGGENNSVTLTAAAGNRFYRLQAE